MIVSNIFLVLILLFTYSCSSTDKDSVKEGQLDELFESISNEDFKKKPLVKYSKSMDYISNTGSSSSSVKSESSQMLPDAVMNELESGKDPLLVMLSYCRRGNFAVAVKLADGLYDKYYKHPGYWNQLGSCYYRKGDLTRAVLMYNKSRVMSSRYAPAINNLGVVYQIKNEEEKSFAAYKKAEKTSPYALTPLLNRASLLLKYGHYNKAQIMFQKLFSHGPADPLIINGLAVAEMMGGEYIKAVKLFQRLDDATIRKRSVAVNYAFALNMIGRKNEAVTILDSANDDKISGSFNNYYNKVAQYVKGDN